MENSTSSPQAVQINVSQAHMLQQGAATTSAAPLQIFAQDASGTGKAFYIIDPSQVAGSLQMISNPDQRFEFSNGTASSSQNLNGNQPAQGTAVVVRICLCTININNS